MSFFLSFFHFFFNEEPNVCREFDALFLHTDILSNSIQTLTTIERKRYQLTFRTLSNKGKTLKMLRGTKLSQKRHVQVVKDPSRFHTSTSICFVLKSILESLPIILCFLIRNVEKENQWERVDLLQAHLSFILFQIITWKPILPAKSNCEKLEKFVDKAKLILSQDTF